MSVTDMKVMRQVSKYWNGEILQDPRFCRKVSNTMRTAWYDEVRNVDINYDTTIRWSNMTLKNFKLYKNQKFLPYWMGCAPLLTNLSIHSCSFECDGFRFLLDFSPNLTTLKMKDVKLRDLSTLHDAEGGEPRPLTDQAIPEIGSPLKNLTFQDMYVMESCFFDYLVERTGALESISVKNCFTQELPLPENPRSTIHIKDVPPEPTMVERAFEFHDNLVFLFERNFQTLKKMTIMDFRNIEDLLNRIEEESRATPDAFPFPEEMKVSFTSRSFAGAPQFFTNYCRNVTNLKLCLTENVPNQDVVGVLNLVNRNLERLKISVKGPSVLGGLDLNDTMRRFMRLRAFEIQDRRVREYRRKILGEISSLIYLIYS